MAFQLVMKNGPAPGKVYSLDKSEISIGRDAGSDVFINDVEVSRQHARLNDQAGNYVLEDLGSTNGTFVNEQRVVGSRILQPGDTILLGENVSLTFDAVPFDPNATQVSPASTLPEESPPLYENAVIQEEQPPPPPPLPEQPVYAGRVPISPVEPLIPEESSPRRTWLWAGCGCAVMLACVMVGVAFVFDYINLYCTPPFRDVMVIFGAVCP
jgi:predicted component of type VI protein secretion system